MLTSIFARALVFCQPGQTHCFQRHSYQSQTGFTSIWSWNLTEAHVDTIGQPSSSSLTVCSLFVEETSSVQTQMKSPYKLQRIFLSLLYCILYCIILQFSCFNLSVAHLDLIFQYIKFEVTKYGLICSPPTTCCQYPVAINGDSLGVLRHLRQIGTLQLSYTIHIYSQTTSTIHIVLSYTHSIRLLSLLLEQNAKIRPVYEMCCCCLLTWLEYYTNNFVSK